MKLTIISPEKTILEKDVLEVTVPTTLGIITILPNHTHFLSTLSLGNITFKTDNSLESSNEDPFITIESGFLTTDGKEVKILTEVAIYNKDLAEQQVQTMKENAIKLMEKSSDDKGIEKLKSQTRIADLHLISRKRRKI